MTMCEYDVSELQLVFFFKKKTAYEMRISDWSSDVCSSDCPARPGDRASEDTRMGTHHDRDADRRRTHGARRVQRRRSRARDRPARRPAARKAARDAGQEIGRAHV